MIVRSVFRIRNYDDPGRLRDLHTRFCSEQRASCGRRSSSIASLIEVKCELRRRFPPSDRLDLKSLQGNPIVEGTFMARVMGNKSHVDFNGLTRRVTSLRTSREIFSLGRAPTFSGSGLGANSTSQATKISTVSLFLDFSDFLKNRYEFANRPNICIRSTGLMIEGDLKLDQMFDLTFPLLLPGNVADNHLRRFHPMHVCPHPWSQCNAAMAVAQVHFQSRRSDSYCDETSNEQRHRDIGPGPQRWDDGIDAIAAGTAEALQQSGFLNSLLLAQRPLF